jgi:murein L,D-transpeptidase YafK
VAGAAVLALACAKPPPPSPPPLEPEIATPDPFDLPCYRVTSIEVRKSERLLLATCEDGALRRYTVALGRENTGPKRALGDRRTPEGDYRVSGPPRKSRFRLFLPFDYPGVHDAEAALAAGEIDADTRDAIVQAHAAGRMPPQHTPLGGLLGFHGEGMRWRGDSQHLDWTEGCVAMNDDDIAYLAARTPPGTPVRIVP